jgi:hypothetical protein
MSKARWAIGVVLAIPLGSCGDGSPDTSIDTVDELLAGICAEAAQCPGITATQQDLDACPLGIRSQLGADELSELEQVVGYPRSQQQCVLQCMGDDICGRFGGDLSNISDSDVMEPFRECELRCR